MLINNQIKDPTVRLIDEGGAQLGIMKREEAQKIADYRSLDLVCMSPNANPAVCKIMNYGKYRFDMIKKEKEAKRTQKIVEVKEITLSQTIDVGDINTKARKAIEFLKNGNKVKISLRMFGRQLAHADISIKVVEDFFELLKEYGTLDKKPTQEGRSITTMVSPITKK